MKAQTNIDIGAVKYDGCNSLKNKCSLGVNSSGIKPAKTNKNEQINKKNKHGTATKSRPPRVLLVEDEPIGQVIGQGFLEGLGCDFTIVGDAMSALGCFMTHDLVLLDLGLPDMSGSETCMVMRTKNTKIPIIAYTVMMNNKRMQNMCSEAGFTDYLEKPVVRELMYNTLLKYLPKRLAQKLKPPQGFSSKK